MDRQEHITKKDVWQEVTNRILAQLEHNLIPWQKSWRNTVNGVEGPYNFATGRPYSGVNIFLLGWNRSSQAWAGFNQIKSIGGHVKRGEKASYIIKWNRVVREKENHDGETEKILLTFPLTLAVFNLEQTEGCQIGERPTESFVPIISAQKIVDHMPSRPLIHHRGNRAYYSPLADSVTMPEAIQFENSPAYYDVLFHELGHSTGHESRLNRKGVSGSDGEWTAFGSSSYAKEELIAEMTAAFLDARAGIENRHLERNAAAYCQSWMKHFQKDKRMFLVAAAQAQKAASFILNEKPEP